MTDIRETLDEIAERADRMTVPDPTGMRIAPDTYLTDDDRRAGDFNPISHIAADLRSLVAALRAVLDAEDAGAWRTGVTEVRAYDHETWLKGYVFARSEAIRAITEALGGGHAHEWTFNETHLEMVCACGAEKQSARKSAPDWIAACRTRVRGQDGKTVGERLVEQ